ncbi:antitoxin [Prauserella oleivorans]|uniref:Antitoxin n=1 Tax=Prauserella oleivorans TaxID=1478153 RepID=A0ABW5WD20_9PSEU
MGINFNELKKKAQDALTKNSDKVEQGIDKASGFAKSRFGNKADKIDDVTKKAKDYLHKQSGGQGGRPGSGGPQAGPGQQPGAGPEQPPQPPVNPPNPPNPQ